MKTFKQLYEAVGGNFKSTFGDIGTISELGDSTSSLTIKKASGGYESKDVHNSKLYIQTGKYKGKTVQDVAESDPAALKKLLSK